MADPDKINQEKAPAQESDDTKTRKTVRLRPSVTPAGINLTPMPKAPLSKAPNSRDTDTGNLEVMEDTQTRRTVKLKPIATQIEAAIQPKTSTSPKPAGDGANTQTRKTIVLKPTAVSPSSVKVDGPVGTAPSESEDTKTRKTVRLRPSAVTPDHLKVAPGSEPGEANPDSSDTIKITRPARSGGMIPPKIPIPGTAAAESSKATVVLPGINPAAQQPEGNQAAPSHSLPVAKPLPGRTPPPQVASKPASPQAVPKIPTLKKGDEGDLSLKQPGSANATLPGADLKNEEGAAAEAGSEESAAPLPLAPTKTNALPRLYLILAAVSLVLITATLALTTVQYLNIWAGQNITLPLAPQAK